jgi:hypothetical protein
LEHVNLTWRRAEHEAINKDELWAFVESIKDYCNRDIKLSSNVSFHACGEMREQVSSYRGFYHYEPADLPNGIFRFVSFYRFFMRLGLLLLVLTSWPRRSDNTNEVFLLT